MRAATPAEATNGLGEARQARGSRLKEPPAAALPRCRDTSAAAPDGRYEAARCAHPAIPDEQPASGRVPAAPERECRRSPTLRVTLRSPAPAGAEEGLGPHLGSSYVAAICLSRDRVGFEPRFPPCQSGRRGRAGPASTGDTRRQGARLVCAECVRIRTVTAPTPSPRRRKPRFRRAFS